MRLPNFFIIGAPKSGTTALYDTIKQHPDIYMSPIKEPRFFIFEGEPKAASGPASGHFRRTSVWKPLDYALLFAGVKQQRAIGEASPIYLRTPLAAKRIRKNMPQSRIIAVLRQPAERAYSNYTFLSQHHVEPARTFEEAIAHEETRIQEGWLSWFHSKQGGYYHAQLSVYYDLFPREQIRIYLYEDWRDDPRSMLRDLFGFLEVDENFIPEIKRSNVTRLSKNIRFHGWAMHPERLDRRAPFLPLIARRAVMFALRRIDSTFNLTPPPPLDPDIRARLTADYRGDILKLQDLIGRDLSHWLKT